MAKDRSQKKRLHIARVPYVGTEVLTKCGRKKNTGNFTNPTAMLCPQCLNLSEDEGLTVTIEWVPNNAYAAEQAVQTGWWRVKATPPQLELVTRGINTVIVDRNDPEAKAVVLTHDKLEMVLGERTLGLLWDQYGSAGELALTR